MQEKVSGYHPLEEINVGYEDVLNSVDELSEEDKQKLMQHLLGGKDSPFTVVFGNHNATNINNSVVLQLNGEVEDMAEELEKVPQGVLQKILEAIAIRIGNKKPSK